MNSANGVSFAQKSARGLGTLGGSAGRLGPLALQENPACPKRENSKYDH